MNGLDVNLSLPTIIDPTNPITRGLVAAYAMDEGAGSVVHDLSGLGHNGTLSGGSWIKSTIGAALDFDDTSSEYIDCGDSTILDGLSGFTISMWVKSDDATPSSSVYLASKDGPTEDIFKFYWTTSNDVYLNIYCTSDDGFGRYVDAITEAGVWTHIVGRYDGVNSTVFCNGVQGLNSAASGLTNSGTSSPLRLGASSESGGIAFWDGQIANALLYNRALSPSEIQQLYADPDAWRRQRSPWELWTAATSVSAAADTGFMTTSTGFWGY